MLIQVLSAVPLSVFLSTSLPASAGAPLAAVQEEAPRGKALKQLVESLYAVRPYRRDSRKQIDELLASFGGTPAPEGSSRKATLKVIEKAWGKLRELPKKGEHWYWDDDEGKRGRFFVSGKTSRPKGLFIGLHGGGVGSADASSALGAYQGPACLLYTSPSPRD